jgi:hypothetical protein
MAKHSSNILELARRGASERYVELKAELADLLNHFPDLASTGQQLVRRGRRAVTAAAKEMSRPQRRRRQMSPAARKAVSARMKKYWAARRKAKTAKAS